MPGFFIHKKSKRVALISALLITLTLIIALPTPTHALTGTATQAVNINILPRSPGGLPSTGAAPNYGSGSVLESNIVPVAIIGVIIALVAVTAFKLKFFPSRRLTTRPKPALVLPIAALSICCGVSLYIINTTSAESVSPTISLSPPSLSLDITQGGSASSSFNAIVATDIDVLDYELSAVADTAHSGINISISDGILTTPITTTPTTFKSISGNAATPKTFGLTLGVDTDTTTPVGSYTVLITYTIETTNIDTSRTVTGFVWPMATDIYGMGSSFLDLHDVTVELRSTFLTPAPSALSTKPLLIDSISGLGQFTIADVPFGTYVLYIHRPGYLTRAMLVSLSLSDPNTVQLAPPGPADAGVFNLWWGDADGNGVVDDIVDQAALLAIFNATFYDPEYNAAYDFNADAIISSEDVMMIIEMNGRTISDYPGTAGINFSL